jgi:hypothetical protein
VRVVSRTTTSGASSGHRAWKSATGLLGTGLELAPVRLSDARVDATPAGHAAAPPADRWPEAASHLAKLPAFRDALSG